MEKVMGKHYAKPAEIQYNHCGHLWDTVSVGVCPVLPNAKGGPKLGATVVRVSGPNTEDGVAAINKLAEIVANELDDGKYKLYGPKTLDVGSHLARSMLA